MKKLLLPLVSAMLLSLSLTTCKPIDTPSYNSFIGQWDLVAIYVNGGSTNMLPAVQTFEPCLKNSMMELFSDMTFAMNSDCGWMADNGTYTFSNDSITCYGTQGTQVVMFTDGVITKYITVQNGALSYNLDLRFKKREAKSRYDVTISVIDEAGNSLAALVPEAYQLARTVSHGGAITIEAPALSGYELIDSITPASVTLTDVQVDQEVTFIYRVAANTHVISIALVDGSGASLSAPADYSVSRIVAQGASITIEAAVITGYELTSASPVVLTDVQADQTVTFTYNAACGDGSALVGTWAFSRAMMGGLDQTTLITGLLPCLLTTNAVFAADGSMALNSTCEQVPSGAGTFCVDRTNSNIVAVVLPSGSQDFTIVSSTEIYTTVVYMSMSVDAYFTK